MSSANKRPRYFEIMPELPPYVNEEAMYWKNRYEIMLTENQHLHEKCDKLNHQIEHSKIGFKMYKDKGRQMRKEMENAIMNLKSDKANLIKDINVLKKRIDYGAQNSTAKTDPDKLSELKKAIEKSNLKYEEEQRKTLQLMNENQQLKKIYKEQKKSPVLGDESPQPAKTEKRDEVINKYNLLKNTYNQLLKDYNKIQKDNEQKTKIIDLFIQAKSE